MTQYYFAKSGALMGVKTDTNEIVRYPGPFLTFHPKTRILQGKDVEFHLPVGKHERSLWLYERTKQMLKQYTNA